MQWRCPICKKPTDSNVDREFPFCSERCRLTDLGNWASEKYKVSESAADESENQGAQRPRESDSDESDE